MKSLDMNVPEFLQERLEAHGGIEGIVRSLPAGAELERKSRIYHALSDPTRLKILYLLSVEPLCVCLIKKVTEMPDSKLSYHLNVLKDSGLIVGERRKNWIIYRLTEDGERILVQAQKQE